MNIARTVFGCCLVGMLSGCATGEQSMRDDLVLLTREGCVNTATMRGYLDAALGALRLPTDYQVVDLDTVPEIDPRGGYPTPTVLYRNADLFGMEAPPKPHPPRPVTRFRNGSNVRWVCEQDNYPIV